MPAHVARDTGALFATRSIEEKRIKSSGAHRIAAPALAPIVVGVGTAAAIPQIAIHRCAAVRRALVHAAAARGIARDFVAPGECELESIEEAVQIDRDEVGCMYRGERAAIRQPARAEVPAALG